MKEIGELLRKKRLLLDKTLEEISQETKVTIDKLKAIEDGNLDFFEDDFSYLKFYVRFYFKHLNLDFEEHKDAFFKEIDLYQQTQTIQTVQNNKKMNESIRKRVEATTSTLSKDKRKIDYSMISLIVVIICLIGVIGYVAINYGKDLFKPSTEAPIVVATPSSTPDVTIDPIVTPPIVTSTLLVEKEDFKRYLIKGYQTNEEVKIDIEFAQDTWTRILVNDVVSNNPASAIYKPSEKIQFIINAQDETKVTIHLGYYLGNKIFINGVALELDEKVANLTSGQQVDLVFKGE